jgi:hypothetical protein
LIMPQGWFGSGLEGIAFPPFPFGFAQGQNGAPFFCGSTPDGPCLCLAPSVRVLRLAALAQDDGGWSIAFPPFRKVRERMGHPFLWVCSGGPCLPQGFAPSVRVLPLHFVRGQDDNFLESSSVARC